jgi:hypothetical protein
VAAVPALAVGADSARRVEATVTRCPGRKRVTCSPIWWTIPTASCPRIVPLGVGKSPAMQARSAEQTDTAVVRTTTSPGPASGRGRSSKRPLPSRRTNAFIDPLTGAPVTGWRCH